MSEAISQLNGKKNVQLMNITYLTEFRKDDHLSLYYLEDGMDQLWSTGKIAATGVYLGSQIHGHIFSMATWLQVGIPQIGAQGWERGRIHK